MARRHDTIGFSSDSFLDVVANLVGILIILIVLTGLRVSRAPVELPVVETEQTQELEMAPEEPDTPVVVEAPPLPAPAVVRSLPTPAEPPPGIPAEVPEEPIPVFPPISAPAVAANLTAEYERMQRELARIEKENELTRSQLAKLRVEQSQIQLEKDQLARAATSQQSELAQERKQLDISAQSAEEVNAALTRMQQQIGRLVEEPPPVVEVEHYLTPVGRIVTGKELHFRLAENRVAHVPVKELSEMLQADIERRKKIMLTQSSFQGRVGPRDGFSMSYILQRDSLSLADEMRLGPGTIRMTVTGWIIHPESHLRAETTSEALQLGSEFRRALQTAGPSSTVTFWVYPDSFEIHRELKKLAHDSGFWVASRPLPSGVPISGSPQGAKSLAQ